MLITTTTVNGNPTVVIGGTKINTRNTEDTTAMIVDHGTVTTGPGIKTETATMKVVRGSRAMNRFVIDYLQYSFSF